MFTSCRNMLKENLKKAGFKEKQIYTSKKRLALCNESRVAAVLFEDDTLTKNRSKRIYQSDGERHKRRRKYDRDISFSIAIGEYEIEKVEEIYNKFLEELPEGIYVDGNYVEIIPSTADWMDDEDTILKAKCAVQITITCKGGVYKDTDFAKADEVNIAVEKENRDGKEEHDNSNR